MLLEVHTISTSGAVQAGTGASNAGGGAPPEPLPGALRDDAVQAALAAPQFR